MKNEELMKVGQTAAQTKGRGGNSNFPGSLVGAKSEDISRCIGNCLAFFDQPIVKSDEECRQRLYDFFHLCQETGQLPTVEKMIMALGCVKSTVWEWENGNGCSPARSNLIKKAKEFIHAFESEMVTEGKINPVVYIFRAKNYFGMKDQQDITVRPETPLGADSDPAELQRRIEGSVITDED